MKVSRAQPRPAVKWVPVIWCYRVLALEAFLTWDHLAYLDVWLDIGVVLDVVEDLRAMCCHRLLKLLQRVEVEPAGAGERRR